jgi:F-type H+-transporting ATPase subunit b
MATAVIALSGGSVVSLVLAEGETGTTVPTGEEMLMTAAPASGEATVEAEKSGPNPIAPEGKELIWGFGSFLVFLAIMRLFLVPKVRKGMAARYDGIRADLEGADTAKADARGEVAKYEAALVEVRAEAAKRIDAARVTLDSERAAAIAAANQRIAAKKAEAEAAVAAERAAVRDQISAAVATVTSTATSIAVGKSADNAVVTQAVTQAMQNNGAR